MTIDAELTFHILHHSARRLAEDDLGALTDLGFSIEDMHSIETLTLKDLVHLGRLGGRFLDIKVNAQRFGRALAHVQREADNEKLQETLLRLRAPGTMMRVLFGMTPLQYANRRKRLGLFGAGVGRPAVPTEETERAIRAAWQQQAHLTDGERYLATARATGALLSVIWPVVRVHESDNAPCPNDSSTRGEEATDVRQGHIGNPCPEGGKPR